MRGLNLLGFVAVSLGALTAPAFAGSLSVPIDEVRMVTFVKPVATVFVGNPMIADITVVDSRHVFVLGKTYGATNVIALDANGKEVADNPLTVYSRSANVVTLNRGSEQVTYTCAGSHCQTTPMPGDDKDAFERNANQVSSHEGMGEKEAIAQAKPGSGQ